MHFSDYGEKSLMKDEAQITLFIKCSAITLSSIELRWYVLINSSLQLLISSASMFSLRLTSVIRDH